MAQRRLATILSAGASPLMPLFAGLCACTYIAAAVLTWRRSPLATPASPSCPHCRMKDSVLLRRRLATPFASFAGMVLFAGCVAIALRIAWDPPIRTYVEYVPIGAVFAGLVWDRLFPNRSGDACAAFCDATIVGLAAMRAIIPPLPFASGHTVLACYAAITARQTPVQATALVVLVGVMYDKLFVSGGATSMLIALVVAVSVAALRRHSPRVSCRVSTGRRGPAGVR
jgi:hypothetical protein